MTTVVGWARTQVRRPLEIRGLMAWQDGCVSRRMRIVVRSERHGYFGCLPGILVLVVGDKDVNL